MPIFWKMSFILHRWVFRGKFVTNSHGLKITWLQKKTIISTPCGDRKASKRMEAQTAGTVGTVGTVPQRAASHPGATPVASPSDQTSWESQIGVR